MEHYTAIIMKNVELHKLTLKDAQNILSENSKLPNDVYSMIHFCKSKLYKEILTFAYVHNEVLLQQFILGKSWKRFS